MEGTAVREITPGDGIGKRAPAGWHTTSQAAALVDRSPDRLRLWRSTERFVPSGWMRAGLTKKVYLYSDADIDRLREFIATIRIGRPRESRDGDRGGHDTRRPASHQVPRARRRGPQ